MSYFIHAKKFFLNHTIGYNGYLEIQDNGKFGLYYPSDDKPKGAIIKNYSDMWVAPGYFDTHIHGMMNEDVNDSSWNGINKISKALLKYGVTSWLPTAVTDSEEKLENICVKIGKHKGKEEGAKIRGIHFEGPFFTPEHGGAENKNYMCDPSIKKLNKWEELSENNLVKISMAPERKGALNFIREATKKGVVISLGHSNANYEAAIRGIEAGATMFTHTFNGMNELSQHAPNIIGAALSSRMTIDELICDGHHVRLPVIKALIKTRRVEHICLMTDSLKCCGLSDGNYKLAGLNVYVKDGMVRVKNKNILAGSILTLDKAVKNLVDWEVVTPEDAILMASYVPAKSMNLQNDCGVIKPDVDADFIILKPDLTVKKTYLNGELKYSED